MQRGGQRGAYPPQFRGGMLPRGYGGPFPPGAMMPGPMAPGPMMPGPMMPGPMMPARGGPPLGAMMPARGGPPPGAMMPARGPPAPQARDPSAMAHDLYVIVSTDPADAKSRALTLELLRYVTDIQPVLRRMGIDVRVNKIGGQHLRDERLLGALRQRGISSLPALVTPSNVYIGLDDIRDLYDRNIDKFVGRGGPGGRPRDPDDELAADDDLEQYYRSEMTLARAEEDDDELAIGKDSGDMMDDYRRMMSHRETAGRRPGAGRPPAAPPEAGRGPPMPAAGAAARPALPDRRDNVGPPAARPTDPEDDEISATIARLAGDIEDPIRARGAGAGVAVDSLGGDDDGDNDGADDQMERAYWANQMESM